MLNWTSCAPFLIRPIPAVLTAMEVTSWRGPHWASIPQTPSNPQPAMWGLRRCLMSWLDVDRGGSTHKHRAFTDYLKLTSRGLIHGWWFDFHQITWKPLKELSDQGVQTLVLLPAFVALTPGSRTSRFEQNLDPALKSSALKPEKS